MAEESVSEAEARLLDELHLLDEEKQLIRVQMLDVQRRLDLARAQARLDKMPEHERAALLQVVQAEGLSTSEAVQ